MDPKITPYLSRRLKMIFLIHFFSLVALLLHNVVPVAGIGEVIYAINAGGDAHIDVHGIKYDADPAQFGVASDYGKSMPIQRIPPQDAVIYQTERYDMNSFAYDIPVEDEGDYVLVLKFSEVWFAASGQKVFDIVLNDQHVVITNLDIYEKVGRGSAHDELVPFTINKSKLKVKGEVSTFHGTLSVEFVKGDYDNPKINALVVMKGAIEDIPKLPPIPGQDLDEGEEEEEDEEDDGEETDRTTKKFTKKSGPKVIDPYAADESSFLYPILIAVAVFVPTLFCLCRL